MHQNLPPFCSIVSKYLAASSRVSKLIGSNAAATSFSDTRGEHPALGYSPAMTRRVQSERSVDDDSWIRSCDSRPRRLLMMGTMMMRMMKLLAELLQDQRHDNNNAPATHRLTHGHVCCERRELMIM